MTALRESLRDFGSVQADPLDQDDAARDYVITKSTELEVRIGLVSRQRHLCVARRLNRMNPCNCMPLLNIYYVLASHKGRGFNDKSTIREPRGQYVKKFFFHSIGIAFRYILQ